MSTRSRVQLCTSLTILAALLSAGAFAQVPLRDDNSGPYNVTILEGGEGLTRKLEPGTASLDANGAWSMTGWVNPRRVQPGPAALLVVGNTPADARAIFLGDGKPGLYADNQVLVSDSAVANGSWTAIAATYDGTTARLYVNGRELKSKAMQVAAAGDAISVAPLLPEMQGAPHFGGQLADLKLHSRH